MRYYNNMSNYASKNSSMIDPGNATETYQGSGTKPEALTHTSTHTCTLVIHLDIVTITPILYYNNSIKIGQYSCT